MARHDKPEINYRAEITTHSWWVNRAADPSKNKDRYFFLLERKGGWVRDGVEEPFTEVVLIEQGKEEPIEYSWEGFIELYNKQLMDRVSRPNLD